MAVPAGWYVDAIDPGQQRWWDGNQWTQHVRPQQTEVPIPEIPKHTPALDNEKLTHRNLLRRLGPSTYVAAGLFVIALIPLAGTGYFSTWLVLADIVLLLTGLYTLISGRRSWARFTGRQAGAVAFGGGLVGLVIVPLAATGNYWVCLFLIALLALVTGLYTLVSGRRSWARIAGHRIGAVVVGGSLVGLIASMSAVAATLPPHVKVAASAQSSVSAVRSANPTPTPTPSSATATPTSRSSPSPTPSPTVTTVPSPFADAVVSGTFAVNASGAVLPDKAATPGATNPKVVQGTINETICLSGWTATVRPESSLTTTLKLRQLAAGYAYDADTNPADYEEDHLIPLELGGAPADALNLWPDPYNLPNGARTKDTLENKLHDLVCSGTLPLATAQQAIASDWWAAYETYVAPAPAPAPDPVQAPAPAPDPVHAPAPAPAPAPDPVQAPDPGPAPAPAPGGGATALCVDGSYSFSATHSGTCSHHKGVAVWYK